MAIVGAVINQPPQKVAQFLDVYIILLAIGQAPEEGGFGLQPLQ